MELKDKIREARLDAGLTQTRLAKAAGLSLRTVQFYEKGDRRPQNAGILLRLARALKVPSRYLLSDGELNQMREQDAFLEKAGGQYSPHGKVQVKRILRQASALFAGGDLSEDDREAFFETMTKIYFDAKKRARKYAKKPGTPGR